VKRYGKYRRKARGIVKRNLLFFHIFHIFPQ
jgi:hypothetical protein